MIVPVHGYHDVLQDALVFEEADVLEGPRQA